jgi:hypothetical protein
LTDWQSIRYKTGMEKKPVLRERFAAAAKDTGKWLARGMIRHSEKVEGLSYMVGNLILMGKDSWAAGAPEFTPNVLAAMLFLTSDAAFAASGKRPWTRRISGACIMTAASLVLYAGLDKPEALAGHIATTGMIALSGLQILLENNMREWSAALAAKPRAGLSGLFAKAAEKYTAYPLLVTAAPNFLQKPFAVGFALLRNDPWYALTNAFWMVGDTGMALTDKLFKNMLESPEEERFSASAKASPGPKAHHAAPATPAQG